MAPMFVFLEELSRHNILYVRSGYTTAAAAGATPSATTEKHFL